MQNLLMGRDNPAKAAAERALAEAAPIAEGTWLLRYCREPEMTV